MSTLVVRSTLLCSCFVVIQCHAELMVSAIDFQPLRSMLKSYPNYKLLLFNININNLHTWISTLFEMIAMVTKGRVLRHSVKMQSFLCKFELAISMYTAGQILSLIMLNCLELIA